MGIAREDLAPKAYDVLTRDVSLEELNTKVTGPASSTTNAIAKFSGTDGKEIQNSGITIDASNNINGANTLTLSTTTVSPLTISSTSLVANLNADLLDGKHASDFSLTSHNHALNGLSNVTITSISSGEILKWNGSAWINNTLSEAGISETGHIHALSDLTDTNIVTPDNGDALIWNSTSSKWEVGNVSSGTIDSLDDITDVTITDISSDEILKWNGTAWINNTLAEAGISATGHTHSYAPNAFSTIAVSGQSNVVADSTADTLTLVAGTNVTLTTNATNDSVTITSSHPDITAASSVNNSGRTYIQDITLDSDGHVTALSSATESVVDTNTTYSIKASSQTGGAGLDLDAGGSGSGTDTVKFASGTNVTVAYTDANTITINSTHPDITPASSVNNSGRTYIQDITVDANGHVTGLASATEADQNTFNNIHALNSSGTDVTNSPFTATTSTSSLNLKAGTGITLAMDTSGIITITGSTTYTHPTFTTRSINIDTSGVDVLDTLTFTSDANGHVTAASGATRTLPSATTSVTGVLTSTDWNTFNGKMDATASTTAGYVPVWGANGKTLGTGYSVETTMTGSSSALVRADAVKTYIDGIIATADALVYKGVIDCSTNPNYPAGDKGHVYKVSVAGKIGGASGVTVEAGDMLICNTDSTASGTQATVGSKWDIIQNNIDLSTLQPKDADLTAIAGLTGTGFAVRTASDTWANRSITAGTGISITNGDGISGNVTVAHTDTSTQATVTNTGRTYIQSITLDGMGHITGLASATETVTNTDTNYYPTAYAWSNGTTAGPTGSLTGTGMSAVSFGAIPSASETVSGIVTTGAQTIAGVKTFRDGISSNVTGDLTGNVTGNVSGSSGSCTGNAATATKLSNINTTFTGTYPLTVNVNGVIYSHTGITYSGSGNTLTAGTFSGNLTGDVTGNVSGSSGSCTGNAATATKLATARTISLTGDVTGSASFDGSANASITATVADDSHNHTIANVDSLQTTLDGKAASSHTHAGTDVTSAVANATNATTLGGLAVGSFVRSDAADTVAGNHEFYSTDTANGYGNAAIELREVNLVGSAQSTDAYAPMLAFHWSGKYQSRILMSSDGNLKISKSNGTPGIIWHSSNDGAGSGLDADLLDGLSSENFVRAATRADWNTLGVVENVVGQLGWKNYGNGHTIFDASAGTSPTGTAVDKTNSAIAWTTNYPTLMGWNGSSTYGVRVDRARLADSATAATTATKLATARTISLTGDVTGSASFDGSANASITATVADDSHNHTIANVDSLQTTLDGKVPTGRTVTAGNGMTGGGALSANITLTLGTPGSCSTSTSNAVTTTSHTHAITGVATSDHTHTAFDEPITIGGDTLIGNAGSARKRLSWGGFYGASATNTGTIKIDLGTDNIMFNARISIRSYLFTATILVGGYTYTGSTTWHSTQATGQIHGGPLNVRFTSSGSNRYIHIGETNTAWSGYLQVTIDEVNNGYGGALFTTPFTITLETAYTGTIDSTIAIPMYSGTADAPTSTSRVNVNGYLYATRVYNAVFNDYAECFNSDYHIDNVKYRIVEIKNGKAHPATEESEAVIGVVSTTYGILLHGSEEEIKNGVKVPVGMAGTLMVDAENIVEEKDINRFVCSGIEGKARVIQKGEAYKYEGCIVGKVIGIDTATNQYKLLIMLK